MWHPYRQGGSWELRHDYLEDVRLLSMMRSAPGTRQVRRRSPWPIGWLDRGKDQNEVKRLRTDDSPDGRIRLFPVVYQFQTPMSCILQSILGHDLNMLRLGRQDRASSCDACDRERRIDSSHLPDVSSLARLAPGPPHAGKGVKVSAPAQFDIRGKRRRIPDILALALVLWEGISVL